MRSGGGCHGDWNETQMILFKTTTRVHLRRQLFSQNIEPCVQFTRNNNHTHPRPSGWCLAVTYYTRQSCRWRKSTPTLLPDHSPPFPSWMGMVEKNFSFLFDGRSALWIGSTQKEKAGRSTFSEVTCVEMMYVSSLGQGWKTTIF